MPRHEDVDRKVADLLPAGRVDPAATLVIETYGPEILGYLRAMLREEASASDAFSVFAENVWRGLTGFRGDASLRVWCYRIAYRAALSLKRDPYGRRKNRLETTMASHLAGRIFATTAVERERHGNALERLREKLDPEEQTLLTLRIDRDMSWREVADVLSSEGAHVEEAALRKRYERLKDKLARAARDEGLFD
ncbi:MAG TPA: sigma-70 family RNA polymerase sigma factor [Anaeromyxobacteraceae bacterium]|nr:sigma-70 family RNA polymerase sigma factor [Anaeromyxobacteraceae bacterium]